VLSSGKNGTGSANEKPMRRQHEEDEMAARQWQSTASGVLIGLGVGVGLGILLAPKSGRDTRDQIVDTVKGGIDGALAQGEQLTRRAQQRLEEARQRVKDAAEAAEQAYHEAEESAVS
jgi:gas vesicle protein